MKKEILVRRSAHCLIAFAPLYFLLPDDLPLIGFRRWVLLIVFLAGIGIFDSWRRYKGITFLGLRPHERKGVASYAWAAAGVTFVLWFITQDIATASLVSMAFVDPFAGELRVRYGKKPWLVASSGIVYFALAFTVMALWADHTVAQSTILALVGAGVAIPSELLKVRYLDDDFTMLVFPAMAMSLAAGFL
jgi:dolichol kinase